MPDAAESGRPRALVVARRGRYWVGEPLFERGPQVSLARGRVNVEPGGIALCRIDQRGGQPIVDLGSADNARDVVGALIADRGLRPTFRDRHQQEARGAIAALQRDAGARRDLTAEPTFTVDPASARDFDDAVSAKREGDGFRIWVHIADVAAHVKPESGLDREARARANSTYAPGTVSPMLPASLSSDPHPSTFANRPPLRARHAVPVPAASIRKLTVSPAGTRASSSETKKK